MVDTGLQRVAFCSNYYNDPDMWRQLEIIISKEVKIRNEVWEKKNEV
jgi:hypothetical protein